MKKVVIDSSVIVKWLHEEEPYFDHADKIIEDVKNGKIILFAPELARYEVGNALLFSKKVSPDEAKVLLESFYLLPIQFGAQSENNANLTYKIAYDAHITYYDASFIALAKQENAVLVTDNIKHQGKTSGVKVIPLSQYR